MPRYISRKQSSLEARSKETTSINFYYYKQHKPVPTSHLYKKVDNGLLH